MIKCTCALLCCPFNLPELLGNKWGRGGVVALVRLLGQVLDICCTAFQLLLVVVLFSVLPKYFRTWMFLLCRWIWLQKGPLLSQGCPSWAPLWGALSYHPFDTDHLLNSAGLSGLGHFLHLLVWWLNSNNCLVKHNLFCLFLAKILTVAVQAYVMNKASWVHFNFSSGFLGYIGCCIISLYWDRQ